MVRSVQGIVHGRWRRRRRPGITLRFALLRLILIALLPLALASGVVAWQLWDDQRAAIEDALRDTALALMLAVDRDVAAARGQLEAVAASKLIDEGRWGDLHALFRSIAGNRPGAVIALVDGRGQLLVQSNLERNARLPNLWEMESTHQTTEWQGHVLPVSSQGLSRKVFASGSPAVSGLYIGLVARRPVIGLSVPVVRNGRTAYAMIYSFPTESLEGFFGAPDATGLRLSLIDQSGVVIARSAAAPDPVGARVSLGWSPGGNEPVARTVRRTASDGVPVLSAYAASSITGWTVRVSEPQSEALAPAYEAVRAWLVMFVLVLLAALASAMFLARRLALPLVALADQPVAAGAGSAPSGIREIDVLRERLVRAAEAEQQRRAEFERRTAAEEHARAAAESERRVREREQELRVALKAGQMSTWRVDAATGKVRFDARHRQLWSLPEDVDEVDASEIRARMHPDDVQRLWREGDAAAAENPSGFALEFRVRDGAGGWRWLAGHGMPLRDESGRYVGMIGVNFDVSERREAEEALRRSEEQFRQITDNVDDVFWIADYPEGKLRYVSPAFERLWGLSRREALNDHAYYMQHIHPDDRERVAAAYAEQARQGHFDIEYRLRCPDGERWIHDRCFPLQTSKDAEAYRTVGIAQDVTERKRNEAVLARFAFVVDSVDDAIVSMDLGGRVQTWNPAAERMYQCSAADVVGKPFHVVMEPASQTPLTVLLEKLARGEAVTDVETMHRRIDGSEVHVSVTLAQIRVGDEITGVAATIRDVTARKEYEQRLRQHMAQLEDADRRKDHFLAMLGHELRNPLAPILNSARLVRVAGHDPAVVERSALTVERQVEHLTRLIDDLLDVARITEGKIVLKRERVDLMPLLYQALESTRLLMEARHQHLTIHPPTAPVFLHADPSRIVQILTNLLNNAAKYTPDEGSIEVFAERQQGSVAIRVRDDGIGIAADVLPTLFVAFAQAPEARERSQGGLGIGLALTKRLVELHGGTVTALSEGTGRGSEFVVVLPLSDADAAERPQGTVERATNSGLRCMVVDDNVDAADSLVALLEISGHSALGCYDAASALSAAARQPPDVAILDIGLPGMDGYELARRMRMAHGPAVYLAALTGYGQPTDAARAREAGFDVHLVKPLPPDALDRLLAAVRPRAG